MHTLFAGVDNSNIGGFVLGLALRLISSSSSTGEAIGWSGMVSGIEVMVE